MRNLILGLSIAVLIVAVWLMIVWWPGPSRLPYDRTLLDPSIVIEGADGRPYIYPPGYRERRCE
jgi:hypothetical protein